MKRLLIAGVFLCLLLSGCREEAPVPPPEETPVPGGDALDAVTYLPEDLLEELESRMQDGKNNRNDYNDLLIEQNVTENLRQMPEIQAKSEEIEYVDYYMASFYEVDFDNDGILDICAKYLVDPSTISLIKIAFYRALPDGGYDDTVYFMENYIGYPFFIQWEGKNYCVHMRYRENDVEQLVFLGMQISCFADGWEQERAYLHLDPETGEITREVYTLGINTEFPLPTH